MADENAQHLQPLQEDGKDEDSSAYASCTTPSQPPLEEPGNASELKVVRFAPASDSAVAVDIDDDRSSINHSSGNEMLGGSLHAPDIQWTLRTRAFRTCLVLAMPWAAYAILSKSQSFAWSNA
ncbi:unnamed protein product [Phytophthora lilii]|uniref:Unnamed protein product n=1 Tax=Phytophthora lilii TaxID=2077276 RepID=A0A9W6UAH6_9STRA|nr:unnamed protein product [Phytophthora lilii]